MSRANYSRTGRRKQRPYKNVFVGAALARALLIVLSMSFITIAEPNLEEINRTLAAELVREGDYDGAAIEYRRLSLMSGELAARDGYRWMSAYYYLEENNPGVAVNVLDDMEQHSGYDTWKFDLLRAEAARQTDNTGEEFFYLNSIVNQDELSDEEADYAARKLAAALIREGKTNEARTVLVQSPKKDASAIEAMDTYMTGKDKSPAVGGWLGMIPGMGYAYAGEYANMVRSIILNSLFIFAMVDTAGDEEWGAFTAITFFELTWYSGSIYGGRDASHRYNIKRKQTLLDAVSGGIIMEPDADKVPVVSLKFRF